MLHKRVVSSIVAAKLAKFVSDIMIAREERRETGKASINRIAPGVNDAGVRQYEMDQTSEEEIERHLIGNAPSGRRKLCDHIDVFRADLTQLLAR